MIWIFPMAGKGSRTRQLGEFKPFVEINGIKMLAWLLKSTSAKVADADKLIFITTAEYADRFAVRQTIAGILEDEKLGRNFELVTCEETPPGPSATVYHAREHFQTDEPVIVVNCDQYIDFDMSDVSLSKSGFLPVYAEFTQKSSYVEIRAGLITKIVEKQNISNLASAGIYAVSRGKALTEAIERQFEDNQQTNGEFYVGVALNNLIGRGYRFYPTAVRVKYDLGDVEGIELFKQMLQGLCPQTNNEKVGALVSWHVPGFPGGIL
jgi:NDP-sugar pyrophosphorylase family protein